MTTAKPTLLRASTTSTLCLWVNRSLESLWLLVAVLVPLAFLNRDFAVSEAVIAYVEVPKIALLRTLVALMAVLWMVEWGLQGRSRLGPLSGDPPPTKYWLRPSVWMARLTGWLRERPTRWLLLAVWFFLGTTLLSTALSGSFNVSLWGEVPGQDGYSAYTVVTYVALFSVVATHLKTKAQLWRLLGAIVGMGVFVSGYAILQHYSHDFFDLIESTGGGEQRVTSFMGNAIFAAAVMLMTIPISLVAATLSLREVAGTNPSPEGLRRRVGPWMLALLVAGLWGAVMMVQLLGITFTFSRGPLIGMLVALSGFLGLASIFVGWWLIVRAVLLVGLTSTFILAVLQGLGSISILGFGPWLSAFFAVAGLCWVAAVLAPWRIVGRVALSLGLGVTLAVAVSLGLLWSKGDSGAAVDAGSPPTEATASNASQVTERFSSIKGQVLGGFIGGRASHWKVSWRLIRDHPWFEFDTLSFSWLRPLVGYGPELFRYTYLLGSPPDDPTKLFPLEPDHAHNFFIHQTVEQGFLGLVSSLGIFAAVFIVGVYQLLRVRRGYTELHTLLLIGLLAIFAGRFLEMNVGVARVSDLTIFWLLLAVFATLPMVMQDKSRPAGEKVPTASASGGRNARRRIRSRILEQKDNRGVQGYDWGLFWRLALVAWITGGIVVLTWVKSVNYVRAAVEVGEGMEQFHQGDFQSTLGSLDRAIELAPDVSLYYNHRANVYVAFQINKNRPKELGCGGQSELPYDVCLAVRSFQSNLEGAEQRPFYYRSRLALANSAYNLPRLDKETVQLYRESLALVPGSWPIRNELADAYLRAGQPEEAIKVLEESLVITGNTSFSTRALFLQGIAYDKLGNLEKSISSLDRSVDLGLSGEPARRAFRILVERYLSTGQSTRSEPRSADAYFSRGLVYSGVGQHERATEDYTQALKALERQGLLNSGSPQFFEYFFNRGLAYFNLGRYEDAIDDMSSAVGGFTHPDRAEAFIIRGISYGELGQAELAIQDLTQNKAATEDLDASFRLNPQAANVYYTRGLAYYYLGQHQRSITFFDEAIRLDPRYAAAYAKRGTAYAALGQQERAIQDLDLAIRLGYQDSRAFLGRAAVYFSLAQYQRAVDDASQAIELNPYYSEAYALRGDVYRELGQPQRAQDDYVLAQRTSALPGDVNRGLAEIARLGAQDHRHYYIRGLSRLSIGQYEQALQDFDQAVGLEPVDSLSYFGRGLAYSGLGQYERAIVDYTRALQILEGQGLFNSGSPQFFEYFFNRGLAYFNLGRYEDGIKDTSAAVGGFTYPDRAEAFIIRGISYGELGQAELAIQDLAQNKTALDDLHAGFRLNPQAANVYYTRGLAYFYLGQYQQSITFFDEAIRLEPRDAAAYAKRGKAYEALGQQDRANQDLDEARRLGCSC